MKKLLLFNCLFFSSFAIKAQEELTIAEWQKKNPSVVFIDKKDANSDLIKKLDELGVKYILFNEEITQSDLLAFSNSNNLKSDYYQYDGFLVRNNEAQFVKEWMANHPDIKIFTFSASQNLTEEQIQFYRSIDALILSGEIITMQDLKNYDNEQ